MLDEGGLLGPHGIRSLSKRHAADPFVLALDGQRFVLDYEPGESTTPLFGGNSNWRGPIWFPINFLLIEALQKHHYFLGDDFKVECPTGSGRELHALGGHHRPHAAPHQDLSQGRGRPPARQRRPPRSSMTDPHWRDLIAFHEYFHGDTGAGLGASHQTGWTGLVAKLIQQYGEYALQNRPPNAADSDALARSVKS